MPNLAPIAVLDGKATPISHTFDPRGFELSDGTAVWQDRVGGIVVGYPEMRYQMRPSNANTPNFKHTLIVTWPVLETISNSTASGIAPAPTKAYDVLMKMEFWYNQRALLSDRKDCYALAANALDNSTIRDAFTLQANFY